MKFKSVLEVYEKNFFEVNGVYLFDYSKWDAEGTYTEFTLSSSKSNTKLKINSRKCNKVFFTVLEEPIYHSSESIEFKALTSYDNNLVIICYNIYGLNELNHYERII